MNSFIFSSNGFNPSAALGSKLIKYNSKYDGIIKRLYIDKAKPPKAIPIPAIFSINFCTAGFFKLS